MTKVLGDLITIERFIEDDYRREFPGDNRRSIPTKDLAEWKVDKDGKNIKAAIKKFGKDAVKEYMTNEYDGDTKLVNAIMKRIK